MLEKIKYSPHIVKDNGMPSDLKLTSAKYLSKNRLGMIDVDVVGGLALSIRTVQ